MHHRKYYRQYCDCSVFSHQDASLEKGLSVENSPGSGTFIKTNLLRLWEYKSAFKLGRLKAHSSTSLLGFINKQMGDDRYVQNVSK